MLVLLLSLIVGLALLFLTVYFVITLSDLECDFMNATQCCSKLNMWVPIELGVHGVLTVLQLLTSHWYLFLLNLPLCAWEAYRFFSKPSGYIGVYDPAEIHNRNQLKGYMQEAMVKLGYHLVFFFVYLYSTIIRLVDD